MGGGLLAKFRPVKDIYVPKIQMPFLKIMKRIPLWGGA